MFIPLISGCQTALTVLGSMERCTATFVVVPTLVENLHVR